MLSILATLAVGAIMAILEVPSLMKDKKRKELWAFSLVLLVGIALTISVSTGIQIPSPLMLLKIIYAPIVHAI